jgi:hypothetical protein
MSETMDNNFKIWLKAIPEGWKFFGAIVGFGTIISVTAVKIDHWKDKGLNQDNVIEYLQKAEQHQKLYNRMNDSLDIIWKADLMKRLDGISDTNKLVIGKQEKIITAVDAIAGKVAGSIEEYKRFVGGLQFELVQSEVMKSVFPETKIKIIKSDSTKKK